MTATPKISSFFLIDTAMLGGNEAFLPMAADARPNWLIPIYKETAFIVSPLVIDIEAAEQAGELDLMMALFNAIQPQLHVSLIDTVLSHADLAQHLRHFIFVRLENGKEPTLRFADCCVLPALAAVLTPGQWATFAGPIVRWRIHQRDGTLTTLPQADPEQEPAATPFFISVQQDDRLTEWEAPDQLIGNLQDMHYGQVLSGTPAEQHRWASETLCMWRAAGQTEGTLLFSLAAAVFETQGRVLAIPGLPDILAQKDSAAIHRDLRQAAMRN